MENPYRVMIQFQDHMIKGYRKSMETACAALDAVASGNMTLTLGECDHENNILNIDCFLHFMYATLVQGMGYALPEDFAEMKFDVQQ